MTAAKLATRVPRPSRDCDVRSLPIGPIDAFVLSQVDGVSTEADLSAICGLDPATLRAGLDRLCTLGAISFDRGAPSSERRPIPRAEPEPQPVQRTVLAQLTLRSVPARSAPPPPQPKTPDLGEKHAADGDAKSAVGDWYGAARAYVRAATELPRDWNVRLKAALALVKSAGDLHQAADLAKQAVDLQTTRVEPRLVLAHVYLAAGLPRAARRVIEGAEQLSPGDVRIGKLRSRLGRVC